MTRVKEKTLIIINEHGQCNMPKDIEILIDYFAERIKDSAKSYNEGLLMIHHMSQRLIAICESEVMLGHYNETEEP